ncbi:hypothetical protein PTTG_00809 [Puccinia triticina 1-1 BBBD Race 1]|uniref:Uncharacterized protein n=1 Tax=Puccinia triticina (isolate 1-1 / race 1 (BBBD)) TaxID=630390 RepID=A0A0C4EJ92_PUCT1|nr:hypothetical protein PTTG_00809 [Puccinia triticina 1-1 BBBD Race 1]
MAQIKLHLLQGDPLLAPRKQKRRKNPTRNDSEYENMMVYDSFITPDELQAFEEGIFNDNQNEDLTLTSREDAFMNTLFDFNLWESASKKPTGASEEIEVVAVESEGEDTNWDPQELWGV